MMISDYFLKRKAGNMIRESSLQDHKKSINVHRLIVGNLKLELRELWNVKRDDLTLCSICQDEHCTPWQTQTARFLEVEQPEN
jgi:hypothetical protein